MLFMPKVCALTGKKVLFGHNVSNANNKTQKMFRANIHDVRVYSEAMKQWLSLKLSCAGMRTLNKVGGVDEWVKKTSYARLSPPLAYLKKMLEKRTKKSA